MVECKGGLRPPHEGGGVGGGKREGGHGYYAAEERFWQERCPHLAQANNISTGVRGGKNANTPVVVQRKTPPANSPPGSKAAAAVEAAGRANYDYFIAEAAYRSSPRRHRKSTDHSGHPSYFGDNDEQVGGEGGGTSGRTRRRRRTLTNDKEGGEDDDGGNFNNNDNIDPPRRSPPPPPPSSTRWAARDSEARRQGDAAARRRRFRSLHDAETVLNEVLESVDGTLSNEDDFTEMATMVEVNMDGGVTVVYLGDDEYGRWLWVERVAFWVDGCRLVVVYFFCHEQRVEGVHPHPHPHPPLTRLSGRQKFPRCFNPTLSQGIS